MEKAYEKLTREMTEALKKSFEKPEYKELRKSLEKAKEDGEDVGTFEMVVSTAFKDRAGEIVVQEGISLKRYKQNPIVLFGHDYHALPVGVTESIVLKNGKLIAKGRFAPKSANPFAQQVRKLYEAKILRTASIGFIVKEMEKNKITKSELLEWSFVPVPANPEALSLAKSLKLDVGALGAKGVFLKKKHILKIKELVLDEKRQKLVIKYTNGKSKTRDLTGTCLKFMKSQKEMDALKKEIGATMVKMQNSIDQTIIKAGELLQKSIEIGVSDTKSKDKNKVTDKNGKLESKKDNKKVEKKVEKSKASDDLKAYEENRETLRMVATAINEGLKSVNKTIKEKKTNK